MLWIRTASSLISRLIIETPRQARLTRLQCPIPGLERRYSACMEPIPASCPIHIGTRNSYYGVGSFLSDDGTVGGNFQFYAYYVGSCSGRGCGPVVVSWHFNVLM